MANKKQTEAMMNSVTNVLDTAAATIKEQSTAATKTPKIKSLEDMKELYQTIDVRIQKKSAKYNKFAHFVNLIMSPDEAIARGWEDICDYEGGGGEYRVLVKPPEIKNWNRATKYESILVMGHSYEVPKSQRGVSDGTAGIGNLPVNPNYQLGAPFGGNNQPTHQIDNLIQRNNEQSRHHTEQAQIASDRMMLMMQQSADKNSQMMMALMTAMSNQNNQPPQNTAQDSEVRVLREKLDRMEQDRRNDEKLGLIMRELADTKQQLRVEASKAQNSGMTEKDQLMMAMFTGNQNTQQASTDRYLDLVRTIMEKPDSDEKISNLMGTMLRTQQGQMELMGSAMQQNLLGSGGGHPVAEVVSQAIEGLTAVGTAMVESKGEEETPAMPYDTAPAEVMPEYPETELGYMQTPQLEEAQPQEPESMEPTIEEIQLSEDDIERFNKDTALSQIISTIQNGIPIGEATARIYAHATSSNDICRKWLQYPEHISSQVLTAFGVEARINELIDNMHKFVVFVSNQGDPNKWSGTKYRPIKAPPVATTSVIPPAAEPEFGVTHKAPAVTGEEYDSRHPTSITPPPVEQPEELIAEIAPEVVAETVPENTEVPDGLAMEPEIIKNSSETPKEQPAQ